MANSKKSQPNKQCLVLSEVGRQLKAIQVNPSSRLLVAFSGGLDSFVLLHALCLLRRSIPFELSAMHVHHGLSPNADAWAEFSRQTCKGLSVPFLLEKVSVNVSAGIGLEAEARKVRYGALRSVESDWLCLAHHQDDQAETLLIQLARGAGVKGLSGMSGIDGVRKIFRPILNLNRSQLLSYANQHGLCWIQDESNFNKAFDRNWWRLEILPLLRMRYPAIVASLARSARHLAEANDLLDELAMQDALRVLLENRLVLTHFVEMSEARQRNFLRWWLAGKSIQMPSEARLNQVCRQLFVASQGRSVRIKISDRIEMRTYQGNAYLLELRLNNAARGPAISWKGESEILLDDGSMLIFEQVLGQGIALKYLSQSLYIGYRRGGSEIRLEGNRPSRGLKAYFQMYGIPPWQRENMPMLYLNDKLAAIPNMGCDSHLRAEQNELGLVVRWHPANQVGCNKP